MTIVNQLQVFDQRKSEGTLGRDGCGINTFKNVLLSLLLAEGNISKQQFTRLSNNKDLVYDIYDAVKEIIAKRDGNDVIIKENNEIAELDTTMPKMFEMFEMLKAGKIDLSKYGISNTMINRLALNSDGKQNVSIVNMSDYCDYGLFCMEEDLFAASTIAKLARNEGKFFHAFAIGYNDEHWMTVALHQDKSGKKQWQFMDSYGNQPRYKDRLVNKIETVLNKTTLELKNYLIEAYDNSSDLINRRFIDYFNAETNRPIASKKFDVMGNESVIEEAKEFYIDDEKNRTAYINYISNRFIFMENADWLKKDIGKEELERVQRLHAITKFMVDNGADAHPTIKDKLSPIATRLEEVIALNRVTETIKSDVGAKPQTQPRQTIANKQSLAAMVAVEASKPIKKPNLFKGLINRINFKGNTPKEYDNTPYCNTIKISIKPK